MSNSIGTGSMASDLEALVEGPDGSIETNTPVNKMPNTHQPGLTEADLADKLEDTKPFEGLPDGEGIVDKTFEPLRDDQQDVLKSFGEITAELAESHQLTEQQTAFLAAQSEQIALTKQKLDEEYGNVDWERLRMENPGLYLSAQESYHAQYGQLQNQYQNIVGVHQRNAEMQQKAAESYASEQSILLTRLIPEWQSPETRQKESQQVRDFLRDSYGVKGEEIEQINDARVVKLARDALKWKQQLGQHAAKARKRKAQRASNKARAAQGGYQPGTPLRDSKSVADAILNKM